MSKKQMLIGIVGAFALASAAYADDYGPAPIAYEEAVQDYFGERLEQPRGARFNFVGAPYRVVADLNNHQDLSCWAIDVRVKARMPNGHFGGYVPYTVIFLDGRPIALRMDLDDFERASAI